MKKANNLKQLCAPRCAERECAMPLAACVHELILVPFLGAIALGKEHGHKYEFLEKDEYQMG